MNLAPVGIPASSLSSSVILPSSLLYLGCFSNATLTSALLAAQSGAQTSGASILTATSVDFVLSAQDPALCQSYCSSVSADLLVPKGNGTLFYMNGNHCSCFDFRPSVNAQTNALNAAFAGSPPTISLTPPVCTACTSSSSNTCGNSDYGASTSLASVYTYSNLQNSVTVPGSLGLLLDCATGFRRSYDNTRCIPECNGMANSLNVPVGSATAVPLQPNYDICQCKPGYAYLQEKCQINRLVGHTSGYLASETYRGCLTGVDTTSFANVSTAIKSPGRCLNFCASSGNAYAFIGYPVATNSAPSVLTCGCSNSQSGAFNDPVQKCTTLCPDSTYVCGDLSNAAFDFYQITANANKIAPYTPDNAQNSSITTVVTDYIGCYNSITPSALLSPSVAINTTFSAQACQRACVRDGFQTALVRNAVECKCLQSTFNSNLGTGSGQNSLFTRRNAVCNVTCSGSSCGGARSFDVYSTSFGFVPSSTPIVPSALTSHKVIASTVNPSSNLDLSYAGCATIPAFTSVPIPFGISIMTLELCAAACDAASSQYSFFAVKTGNSCFCGSASPNIPPPSSPPVCNKVCNGNPAQYCGSSGDEASVYNLQYVAPAFLATNNLTASTAYNLSVSGLGCYQVTGSRLASNGLYIDAKQTVALCQNSCLQAGYFYSGVSNGDTCLCSNGVTSNDVFSLAASASKCTVKCVGNSAQTCGDSQLQYANVYKTDVVPTVVKDLVVDAAPSPYSFIADTGKWADDKTSLLSAFCGSIPSLQAWSSAQVMYPALVTSESCAKYCLMQFPQMSLSAVFSTAPNSFSTCACGPYSALAAVVSAKGKCNAPCPGNSQLSCGRQTDSSIATVSVLSHPGLAPTVFTSPFDSSVNVTTKHAGCYSLPANSNLQPPQDASLVSISDSYTCAQDCFSHGFVFGFQQGDKCLCATSLPSGATLSTTPEIDCNTVCKSNNQVTCGGAVFFDAVVYAQSYNVAPVNVTTPIKAFRLASKTGHAANVAYAGCFAANSVNGEAPIVGDYMTKQTTVPVSVSGIIAPSIMTSTRCISACDQSNTVGAKQYAAAMVTAGNQCLCLASVPSASASATAANTCNVPCGGSATETCGDAVNGQVYALNYETAVTMDTPYPGTDLKNTQYAGCYLGDSTNFKLNKGNAADMTVNYCVQACATSNYAYAALQKGNSCFCSASIANVTSAFRFPDSCRLPCSGNDQVSCGDLRNVNVYYTPLSTDIAPLNFTVPVRASSPLAPYVFRKSVSAAANTTSGAANATAAAITVTSGGCFSADQAAFVQYRQAAVSSKMTVQTCASLCANATANVFAALTNSDTCMCGSSMPQSFSNGVSKCTYACSGDATTSCGDNNYLNVYKLNSNLAPSAVSSGVASDGIAVPSASISGSIGVSGSAFVSQSAFASQSAFVSASVSASIGVPSSLVSAVGSALPSGGISASVGVSGSVGVSLPVSSIAPSVVLPPVIVPSVSSTSTSATVSVTSSASTSSSTNTPISQPPAQPASIVRAYTSGKVAWTYKSCWGEPLPHTLINRALGTQLIPTGASVQSCLDAATARGFTYAGIEYGGECWGTSSPLKGGAIDDSYCTMSCTSSPTQYCGGDWALSLYTAPVVPQNKAVVTVGGNARFYYSTCWGEPRVGRALTNPINNNAVGTIESCLALGLQAGYTLCGLEFGGECWCSKGSLYGGAIENKYCNMPCKGNPSQICGGGNALSLYGRG